MLPHMHTQPTCMPDISVAEHRIKALAFAASKVMARVQRNPEAHQDCISLREELADTEDFVRFMFECQARAVVPLPEAVPKKNAVPTVSAATASTRGSGFFYYSLPNGEHLRGSRGHFKSFNEGGEKKAVGPGNSGGARHSWDGLDSSSRTAPLPSLGVLAYDTLQQASRNEVPVPDVTPRELEGRPIALADFDASNVPDVAGASASNRQKAVDRQLNGETLLQHHGLEGQRLVSPGLKFLNDEIEHDEAMRLPPPRGKGSGGTVESTPVGGPSESVMHAPSSGHCIEHQARGRAARPPRCVRQDSTPVSPPPSLAAGPMLPDVTSPLPVLPVEQATKVQLVEPEDGM